jgi:hypothetical protein
MRVRRVFLFAVSVAVLAAGALQLITSSAATALGSAVTNRVIVLLKNQEQSLPPTRALEPQRQRAIDSSQAPILSQLAATHARLNHRYSLINALAATVSPAEEARLKSNPAVAEVVPDEPIRLASPLSPSAVAPASGAASGTPVPPLPGVCAAPGQVQLDPQALEQINADSDAPGAKTARSLGITGAGVRVGFIADGLDINNQDFIRANGAHVFFDYHDFSGEGLNVPTGGGEAFLDASSVAAQGLHVYNVQNYSDLPLNQPCDIRVEGVAPGASLAGLDIFGREDTGFNSSFLQAIDYAVTHDHVNVLNESLGNNYYPDDPGALDAVKAANDAAVAFGTTVTVSTGDAGVTSTIGTPATDPHVISAGATTTYRLDAQIGYGGARLPGITGWLNNNISSFSSGGFEENGHTLDVVAPGELNWALCSTDTMTYSDCSDYAGNAIGVQSTGGTSESAPLTAGVAALVIEAYRKTHSGQSPTPAVVKQIITSTSDDVGAPADQQGAGQVDAYRAVLAAESYATTTPVGQTALVSPSQLDVIGQGSSPETLTDTVTNNGAASETYTVSSRTLGPYTTLASKALTISTIGTKFTDWQGVTDNATKTTFTVPANENRLNVEIAFHNASATDLHARVRMTLIDPNGKLASYDVPQGDGNYGDAQVTDPAPGTWTAWVYSRDGKDGGTTGKVLFQANAAAWKSLGQVSPSTLTLAPGQSGTVTLNTALPGTPGDVSGSILLTPSEPDAPVTTIPVILRTLIPTGPESFLGVLTGGNGRGINTGETFFYQMDVKAGTPELNAAVLLHALNNPFGAWLISPTGEPLAYAANDVPTSTAPGYRSVPGAQLHVLAPRPGRWTLIVGFMPQVSGSATAVPFEVSTNELPVQATAKGLPNSTSTVLTAGKTYNFNVAVKNSGAAPELYFLDARNPTTSQVTLGELNGNSVTVEPTTINSNIPVWLVPTHTTQLNASATTTGALPIQFDLQGPFGDPDMPSNQGTAPTATLSANPIGQGVWDVNPELVGPTDSGGSEDVTSSLNAITEAFDPMVTPGHGDVWLGSTNPASLSNVSLPSTGPSQTASIPVSITPTGPAGVIDTGTLYVDDANLTVFQYFSTIDGNEVAAIPYAFKVG